MIFSTILSNLLGIYIVNDEAKVDVTEFKQSYLYNDEYKQCAKKHHSTYMFGEPLQCVNDIFIVSTFDLLGASPEKTESPDFLHLKRTLSFTDEMVNEITVINSKSGQLMQISATLKRDLDVDSLRAIAKKISKTHGQPDVTPPNSRIPLWGWKTKDGFDIRLFLDHYSDKNTLSITHNRAYNTLQQMAK